MADSWSHLAQHLKSHHPESIIHGIECRDVPGAGRGIFTTQTIPPSTKLLEIPSTALLNPRTLLQHNALPAVLFPPEIRRLQPPRKRMKISSDKTEGKVLSSKQLMALYLSLHRPPTSTNNGPTNPQSQWDDYIKTLPSTFRPWYPLTWPSPSSHTSQWKSLIDDLPTAAGQKLQEVIEPWERDRDVLLKVVDDEAVWDEFGDNPMKRWIQGWRGRRKDDIVEDLLWGWSNVNTRSLYIPLLLPSAPSPTPATEQNNHSLSPLLDFVNHSSSHSQACLLQFAPPKNGPSSSYGSSFRLISPKDRTLNKDEEVTFSYGARGDEILFSEYGFVPSPSAAGRSGKEDGNEEQELENYWAEIDVSWYIQEEMWRCLPEDEGTAKRLILEKHDYWGDYTFHASPTPSHPSHRLFPSLRLFHLPLSTTDITTILSSSDLKSPSPSLKRFLHTLSGSTQFVDPANELAARKSLVEMCNSISSRADEGFDNILRLAEETGKDVNGFEDAVEMVRKLWRVEEILAGRVKKSVESGQVF